ncbi:hypothetical protein P175DRAFT_0502977 [Aspergillus ochraceoroseus IBT 24754]|uniref:Uncharacterized protein n=3 Tax=Aspergillus subgen. Nidulantes TaxID=2720870 RepID=A0A0F8WB80_9EURO|nr:uncharacterized protein P175DRAFT_0502977 [Aspergillus ochraceoroseus IBT 24754]KKK14672.1 hypothetical protein AOCH_006987 [Aspergillus ochraceoroseus]KKK15125.1 hypothetical protein ARAM_007272 [Aspergillus rambellii]PTU19435.1 hypothetical protein P175DRAFT_0502977 [Aspergillus ochraceoroseus IBT 24754]
MDPDGESTRCCDGGNLESVAARTLLQHSDSTPAVAVAVPSLSSDSASSAAGSSSLSLDTMWASDIVGHGILEDDGTGALVVPPSHPPQHHHRHHRRRRRHLRQRQHLIHPPSPSAPPLNQPHRYICLFHILDCQDTFDDAEEWKTHVLSHFRTHEPPDTARCPLCPGERFTSTPHHRAWDLLLEHVDVAHYQQGETLAGSRPDFELMQYLYRLRVISVDQFKVMQLAPPPSSPAYHRSQEPVRASIGSSDEPYCAPYSRRREERMRGQRRGVNVA